VTKRKGRTAGPRGYLPRVAKSEDWTTPQHIIEAVLRAFGGGIDLDPCSNPDSIVPAGRRIWLAKWRDWYLEDHQELPLDVEVGDGLLATWGGNVFCNPPYSSGTMGAFMSRAEGMVEARGGSAIFLVPSKTDIRAWQKHVRSASAVCFIAGRLTFGGAEAGATFPSALVLWTADRALPHRFALETCELGQVWRPA